MMDIELKKNLIAGVISDTHGLLRPEVKKIFKKVDLILHAGDIGGETIIKTLEEIAPVIAVKGNVDYGTGLDKLPALRQIKIGKFNLGLVHNINDLKGSTLTNNDMIIFGHSHKPVIEDKKEAILFNPGSAGKKRFSLPVSVGLLAIEPDKIKPEIHYISVLPAAD